MSSEVRNDTVTQPKILFVIDSLGTGGAERDLAEKLPHLQCLGVETVVVSLRHREEGVQAELQSQGFDVRILTTSGLMGRVAALRKIIQTEQPDVIQTVLFHSDIAGRLAALGTSAKVISRLVNTDYDMVRLQDPNINRIKFRLARVIDGWTARHLTHHIYANSNAVKTAAMRDLGLPAEKITVIKEVRDAERLGKPDIQRRNQARSRLGLEEDEKVLVTIGRQDFQKGQRYLLEAVGMLISTHPHLVLLVAGRSGDASEELISLRHRLGLQDRVQFLGHREDVPEILAAADLFVFPSFYEGLPGAVIEAMALGLPIVASNIEPVRETVEEGRNAFLVPPAAPVQLAAAITRLLEDPRTAQAAGRRSREIFEESFTLEQSVICLMAYYQQIISFKSKKNFPLTRHVMEIPR